eukprot:234158-Rhodomonas_salina.2
MPLAQHVFHPCVDVRGVYAVEGAALEQTLVRQTHVEEDPSEVALPEQQHTTLTTLPHRDKGTATV